MKKPDENKLDQLFRDGLTGAEGKPTDFREEDWAAMEALLDKKENRKRGLIWLYWASGSIAALLLLFLGLNWFKGKDAKPTKSLAGIHHPGHLPGANGQRPSNTTSYPMGDSAQLSSPIGLPKLPAQQIAKNQAGGGGNIHQSIRSMTTDLLDSPASSTSSQLPLTAVGATIIYPHQSAEALMLPINPPKANDVRFKHMPDSLAWLTTAKSEAELKPKSRALLTAALLTAPDLNKAGAGGENKLGGNAGLQVSVHVSNRWSITTGATYAVKPYRIGPSQSGVLSQYFATVSAAGVNALAISPNANLAAPVGGTSLPNARLLAAAKPATLSVTNVANPLTGVNANCTVLDIPLNINYMVSGNGKRSFSAGAGLSSYFMLTERYSFSYADNSVRELHITNQNQHILGVLNLNTTYQQQVSPNLKLLVQPYLKLPITQIGQEQVNLQSTGIAVGFSWNLSSAKPK